MALGLPSVSIGESVVGLDIGRGLIAAAQVETRANGRVDLLNGGWTAIDPDLGDDALADEIRRLWQHYHLSTFTVCASLRSPALLVRYYRYPSMTRTELEQALWLEAEETLQTERDAIALHWHDSGSHPPDAECDREGVLAAAPQDEVNRVLGVLEKAGLFPIILDTGCTAVSNLYLALRGQRPDDDAVCLVNLLGRHADIAILFNGHSLYPRSLLSRSGAWEAATEYLASSVRDVLKYYQFKMRRDAIKDVLLTGQIPQGDAFVERLQSALDTRVTVWDPIQDLTVRSWRLTQLFRKTPGAGAVLAAGMGLGLRR